MAITEQHTKMIDGVELTPKAVAAIGRPTYDNVEDERRARKVGLAAALRVFGRLGYGEGVAGHITARDPEFTDHFWVNPFGKSFRHMKTSDLILVNHAGEVVYGSQPVNRAAFVLHAAIHKARPDVIGAAHAHSTYGKCSRKPRQKKSSPSSQQAKQLFTKTTGCLLLAQLWKPPHFGSSQWTAAAKHNCWPRPQARRN